MPMRARSETNERMETEKNEFGKECYELHFDQFYGDDEDIIASLVQDEEDDKAFLLHIRRIKCR